MGRIKIKKPANRKSHQVEGTMQSDIFASRSAPLQKMQDFHYSQSPLQRPGIQHSQASAGNLPMHLRGGLEYLSGMSFADVKVHYNSPKPAQLQAQAYAQNRQIHLGPKQERHLPHEAWHLVQQAQGRVSTNNTVNGQAINDNASLEAEADRMGAMAQIAGHDHVNHSSRPEPSGPDSTAKLSQQMPDSAGVAQLVKKRPHKRKKVSPNPALAIKKRNLVAPDEVKGANKIPGIKFGHRVTTVAYGQDRVLGGQYAGVALDADYCRTRDPKSSTALASNAMKASVKDLNSRTGTTSFIIGHLVNHVFGGNTAGKNNFLIITQKMNSAMKNGGEASAKKIMDTIYSKYYQGGNMTSRWVANSRDSVYWYKPGILYETEAIAELTLGGGNSSLIANPNVTPADKNKLVWKLETRIRFILHDYKRTQVNKRVFRYKPTGNYFEMPLNVYNRFVGDRATVLLPREVSLSTPLPTSINTFEYTTPGTDPAVYKWTYWNTDRD
jgi:hypothetical protein